MWQLAPMMQPFDISVWRPTRAVQWRKHSAQICQLHLLSAEVLPWPKDHVSPPPPPPRCLSKWLWRSSWPTTRLAHKPRFTWFNNSPHWTRQTPAHHVPLHSKMLLSPIFRASLSVEWSRRMKNASRTNRSHSNSFYPSSELAEYFRMPFCGSSFNREEMLRTNSNKRDEQGHLPQVTHTKVKLLVPVRKWETATQENTLRGPSVQFPHFCWEIPSWMRKLWVQCHWGNDCGNNL